MDQPHSSDNKPQSQGDGDASHPPSESLRSVDQQSPVEAQREQSQLQAALDESKRRRRRRTPSFRAIVLIGLSLLITGSLTVPLAYVAIPHIIRWQRLSELTHADLAVRGRAVTYVEIRAPIDDRVLQGAIARLDVEDPDNFLHIALGLDRAGLWQHPPVPIDPWLRWIEMLSRDADREARILAAQKLADLRDSAGDPRIVAMLQRLISDEDAEARYNAVIALAELYTAAADEPAYRAMLAQAATDDEAEVARHAWLLLGLLGEAAEVDAGRWADDPYVGQAVIWAKTRSAPASAALALDVIARRPTQRPELQQTDDGWQIPAGAYQGPDPQLVAMAAYALHFSETEAAQAALAQLLPHDHPRRLTWTGPWDQLPLWRAALVTPANGTWDDDVANLPVAGADDPWAVLMSNLSPPVERARLWRIGAEVTDFDAVNEAYAYEPLASLAYLEGATAASEDVAVTPFMTPMARLQGFLVDTEPEVGLIRDLLGSELATVRDLAVVVAMQRLDNPALESLIADLLGDYNDHAKMSGAMLAGMTGLQQELLVERAAAEDVWSVLQIMRLALWLQGKDDEMAFLAPALLTRDDLPTTTILLALMHDGRQEAFDYLFNPRGNERHLDPYAIGLMRRPVESLELPEVPGLPDPGEASTGDDADEAEVADDAELADDANDEAAPRQDADDAEGDADAEPVDDDGAGMGHDDDEAPAVDAAPMPSDLVPVAPEARQLLVESPAGIPMVRLLDELRWWHVLSRYLPAGAPRFDVWGDPLLMQFQFDTLRDWYLLHRHEVKPRWRGPVDGGAEDDGDEEGTP